MWIYKIRTQKKGVILIPEEIEFLNRYSATKSTVGINSYYSKVIKNTQSSNSFFPGYTSQCLSRLRKQYAGASATTQLS